LLAVVLAVFSLVLMQGQRFIPPLTVLQVLLGEDVPGASFIITELRLPRTLVAILAGCCFGLGGAAFQAMLRNPLASPDIIGISAGASTAAVFAIVMLSLSGTLVSLLAIAASLGVALLIYTLSWRKGVAGARLILVGIGLGAMLQSITAYLLTQAPSWSLQEALRWMTGSLNSITLSQLPPLAVALGLLGSLLLMMSRHLDVMRMGDDMASGLGVRLSLTRFIIILSAVGLVACATAVVGPVAFVAFVSGPIATRLFRRRGSMLIPAALIGALLMLVADFIGQFLLPARYPVGVVTGVLGAPVLLLLLMREHQGPGTSGRRQRRGRQPTPPSSSSAPHRPSSQRVVSS
jgi:iron complex transport system permease protein